MLCLDFAISPAGPQKCRRFAARQPSVAAGSFRRKCHADQPTVKTFPRVVIDRRTQVLQIAAGATWAAARFHVIRAATGTLRDLLVFNRDMIKLDTSIDVGPLYFREEEAECIASLLDKQMEHLKRELSGDGRKT
jgi:hypothetical protein